MALQAPHPQTTALSSSLPSCLKKKKKGFYQVFCSYKLNSVPRTFLSTDYTHIPSGWSPIDRFLPATAIKPTGLQFLNFCLPSLLEIIFYFFDWFWKLWPFPSASWSVTFVSLETTLNHLGLMDSRLPYRGSQTCLLSIYLCFCRDSSHWRSCKLEKLFLEPRPLWLGFHCSHPVPPAYPLSFYLTASYLPWAMSYELDGLCSQPPPAMPEWIGLQMQG